MGFFRCAAVATPPSPPNVPVSLLRASDDVGVAGGHGANGLFRDFPDHVVRGIGEENVASSIERDAVDRTYLVPTAAPLARRIRNWVCCSGGLTRSRVGSKPATVAITPADSLRMMQFPVSAIYRFPDAS